MSITSSSAISWNEVEVGYELPVQQRDITAALVVAGAISATHDYTDVHHDYHAARKAGADDVFMNILTTNGLIGKYLTDWCGPTGELKKITVRLAVPNYPGDVMSISGRIIKKYESESQNLVEVEFVGKNKLGNHAVGTAVLALNPVRR
ncbi:MAG: hypothetical protein ACI35J_17170 [Peribacillus sp.]